jgi:hypothetical protein
VAHHYKGCGHVPGQLDLGLLVFALGIAAINGSLAELLVKNDIIERQLAENSGSSDSICEFQNFLVISIHPGQAAKFGALTGRTSYYPYCDSFGPSLAAMV